MVQYHMYSQVVGVFYLINTLLMEIIRICYSYFGSEEKKITLHVQQIF